MGKEALRQLSGNDLLFVGLSGAFVPSEIDEQMRYLIMLKSEATAQERQAYIRLQHFKKWASTFLCEDLFYKPFCLKEGFVQKRTRTLAPKKRLKTIEPSEPFEEMTLQTLMKDYEFQEFCKNNPPKREKLLEMVETIVRALPTTASERIKNSENTMQFCRYRIALALIPDLSEEEAERVLHDKTDLEWVRKELEEEDISGLA